MMVKKIFSFVGKEIGGLHEAAYILAIFSFTSQLLALLRDRMLAHNFGASNVLDVYYTSFRIPDLLYVTLTFIVSASILIPVLSREISSNQDINKIINSVFTVFISLAIFISLMVFIFIEPILKVLAPGFVNTPDFETLVLFTRILLLSPILLGISQLFGSIVQTYKRFFIYAISPILYNIGIIIGIVVLYPKFGTVGLVFGVVLGIVFHIGVQIPFISKIKLIPRFTFNLNFKILKEIFVLAIPRSISLTSSQITMLVLVAIASLMATGSVAVFNFAYNLQSVPLSIIAVSYSLAAFPVLSRLFSEGNVDLFLSKIVVAARHIIFWSIPFTFMFIVLRAQIVRTILGSGAFSWNDTRLVAATLSMFAVSILAQGMILLLVRGYYASGQTKKPLLINLSSTLITIILAFVTYDFYKKSETFRYFLEKIFRISGSYGSEVVVLALAFTVGIILNLIFLWICFERDFAGFTKELVRPLRQIIIASTIGAYVSYKMLFYLSNHFDLNSGYGIFFQGFFAGISGILIITFILFFLKNREIADIFDTLHKRFWKIKPIAEGPKEL